MPTDSATKEVPASELEFAAAPTPPTEVRREDLVLDGSPEPDAPVSVDQLDIVSRDPLTTRTETELAADSKFDPQQYFNAHGDDVTSDQLDKLARVAAAKANVRTTITQDALKLGHSFWDAFASIPGMVKRAAVTGARVGYNLSAPGVPAEERAKALVETVAGPEAAALQNKDVVANAASATADFYRKRMGKWVDRIVDPEGAVRRESEARKSGREITDLTPEQARERLVARKAAADVYNEALQGEGSFAGPVKHAIEKAGIPVQIDPEAVDDMSTWMDPLNFTGVGAGFGAVNRAGHVVARATTKNALRRGMETASRVVGERVAEAGRKLQTAAAGGGLSVTGAAVGGLTDVLQGGTGVTGAAIGAATAKRGAAVAGRVVEAAGNVMAGRRAVPAIVKTVGDALGGTARGAVSGLNPLHSAESALYLGSAALMAAGGDLENAGQLAGTISGFGAVGGAAGAARNTVAKGVQSAVLAGFRPSREALGDIATQSYGVDPVLDAANLKATEDLRNARPDAANRWNYVRALFGAAGTTAYMLPPTDYVSRVSSITGIAPADVHNTYGYFDEPTRTLYLNGDATALGHEVGHAVQILAPDSVRKEYHDAISRAYGPDQVAAFGKYYDSLRGVKPGDPGSIQNNYRAVIDEMGAELFSLVLSSENLTGTPPTATRIAVEQAARLGETLGLWRPVLGGDGASVLGVQPTAMGAQPVRELMRNVLIPLGQYRAAQALQPGAPPVLPPGPPPVLPTPPGTPPPGPATPPSTPPSPAGTPTTLAAPPTPAAPAGSPTPAPASPAPATPTAPPTPGAPAAPATPPPVVPAPVRAPTPAVRPTTATTFPAPVVAAAKAPGHDEAEKAVAGTSHEPAFRALADAMSEGQLGTVPVHIEYDSVKPGQVPAARGATPAEVRAREQADAYVRETLGAMPADVRARFEKVTVPYRWTTRGDNVNVNAMSPDKVAANARQIAEVAAEKGATDLVPYPLDKNGEFTPEGWRQLADDIVRYTTNQANGFGGDGTPIKPPTGYKGFVGTPTPGFVPGVIPANRANFVNLTMALPPPTTSKTPGGYAGRPVAEYPNVQAALLAQSHGRPAIPARTARAGADTYSKGGQTARIMETNPLRDAFAGRGIDFTGRKLFQVTEELNIDGIRKITPLPHSGFRAPRTDLIRGGFMPKDRAATKALESFPETPLSEVQELSRYWMTPEGKMIGMGYSEYHYDLARRAGFKDNFDAYYSGFLRMVAASDKYMYWEGDPPTPNHKAAFRRLREDGWTIKRQMFFMPALVRPDRIPVTVGDGTTREVSPHPSYHEASSGDTNPWIRTDAEAPASNADRVLLVQFSSGLLQATANDTSSAYYDKLYSGTRKGFDRMDDFWEIPQWMGFASQIFPNADVYVVRDMQQASEFLNRSGYGRVAFSSLDVNADFIRKLASEYDGVIDVGGYADPKVAKDLPNARWFNSMREWAEAAGVPYKEGVDYRHFRGSAVIPRLTMSQGCKYKCAFCTVEKKITETPMPVVEQQVDAIAELGTSLVYLNDKTFGQASNYKSLPELAERIREKNPDFRGFVVQTTASQMLRFDSEWLKKSGIRFVELGIETYNDPILKELHKPATEAVMDRAVAALREAGIALIPNIIIGFPQETAATYARTLDWLKRNSDTISHVNIYNLALYKDAELGKRMQTLAEGDFNENVLEKSFHNDPEIHRVFAGDLYGLASDMLSPREAAVQFMPKPDGTLAGPEPRVHIRDIHTLWANTPEEPVAQSAAPAIPAQGAAFMPALSTAIDDAISEVASGRIFGRTVNPDGSEWQPEPGNPVDVVTLNSRDFDAGSRSSKAVRRFLDQNQDLLSHPAVRAGVFDMGDGRISVDINALVPQEHRENTLAFARANNQKAIWDAARQEVVDTGGTGETTLYRRPDMVRALDAVIAGRPFVPDGAEVETRPYGNEFFKQAPETRYLRAARTARPRHRLARVAPETRYLRAARTESGRTLEAAGIRFAVDTPEGFPQGIHAIDENGVVLGSVVTTPDSTHRGGTAGGVYVDRTYVVPHHRGQGLGEALYRELATAAQENGITRLRGDVIGVGAIGLRKKLFGDQPAVIRPGSDFPEGAAVPTTMSEALDHMLQNAPKGRMATRDQKGRPLYTNTSLDVTSTINPKQRFMPVRGVTLGEIMRREEERALKKSAAARPAVAPAQYESATGWITPDGEYHSASAATRRSGGDWHGNWLTQNADDLRSRFGIRTEGGPEAREAAIRAGLVRMRYDEGTGTLTVETSRKGWTRAAKDQVSRVIEEKVGTIDRVRINILERGNRWTAEDTGIMLRESDAEKVAQARALFMPKTVDAELRVNPRPQSRVDVSLIKSRKASNIAAELRDNVSALRAAELAPEMEDYLAKITSQVAAIPGLRAHDSDWRVALPKAVNALADNIEWVYRQVPERLQSQWREWYNIAHDMATRWAEEFGQTEDGVSAINARLSPQKNWYENVTMTRRVLEAFRDNPAWTEQMRDFTEVVVRNPLKNAEAKGATKMVARINASLQALEAIPIGTRLSDLGAQEAAWLIRAYNELYGNTKVYDHNDVPAPGFVDEDTGESVGKLRWQSYAVIASAVRIYRDQSLLNISREVGNAHKVRNFYNNHVDPKNETDVTIDTHAVGVAVLDSVSSTHPYVEDVLSGSKNAFSGYVGTYPIYADAYREAARRFGGETLPREVQSVTWESIRNQLLPEKKRLAEEWLRPTVQAVHEAVDSGRLDPDEGRGLIWEAFSIASRFGGKPEGASPELARFLHEPEP